MKLFSYVNALLIYLVIGVLSYSYYQEFILKNPPCIFCVLQRFFFAGAGVPLTFNAFGPVSFKNIGASILSCFLGSLFSLYQWSGLLINDGVTHAPRVFDMPMYVWAALLFFALILFLILMLFVMKDGVEAPRNIFINVGVGLFILTLMAQTVISISDCGFFFC